MLRCDPTQDANQPRIAMALEVSYRQKFKCGSKGAMLRATFNEEIEG
jgi:hypothetical protein